MKRKASSTPKDVATSIDMPSDASPIVQNDAATVPFEKTISQPADQLGEPCRPQSDEHTPMNRPVPQKPTDCCDSGTQTPMARHERSFAEICETSSVAVTPAEPLHQPAKAALPPSVISLLLRQTTAGTASELRTVMTGSAPPPACDPAVEIDVATTPIDIPACLRAQDARSAMREVVACHEDPTSSFPLPDCLRVQDTASLCAEMKAVGLPSCIAQQQNATVLRELRGMLNDGNATPRRCTCFSDSRIPPNYALESQYSLELF